MPSSLGSLSSPSPSPPPSPTRQDTRASISNNSGAGAGLDSGSELSELTEDEQENTSSKADREERARPSRRGRKRGGIVPAPMWDWAYKNKKDWKSKMLEDEDDEQPRPTKLADDEDDEEEASRSQSGSSPPPERRRKRKAGTSLAVDDDDDEDEEPDMGSDLEDDDASADAASTVHAPNDTMNDADDVSDDEGARPVAAVDARDGRRSRTREASAEVTDEENAEEDDVEAEPDADPRDDEDAADDPPAEDTDDDGEDGAARMQAVPVLSATSNPAIVAAPSSAEADDPVEPDTTPIAMEVDVPAPVPERLSPIIAAAAASSIMAGSSLLTRPPPSPSTSSVASGTPRNQSPASSRSPSPGILSDREPDIKRGAAKTRARPKAGRSARNRSRRKTKAEIALEQDAEHDLPTGDIDDREADVDDVDVDSPEMDVELDLQPAHRAEALDVLATIELKYALLRENLYVEKMESLAWEEALLTEGIHPEMLHLHAELSKRRDKRLELASLRRDYEIVNVTKRRKLDEAGVWSWWKLRRDELQTQMISETNRKRRKLDRERRALDRPQPIRRIPSPPRDIPLAPSLRELIKSSPLDTPEHKKHQLPESSLAYPQLSTLSTHDIFNDLDFLSVHRRPLLAFDSTRAGQLPIIPGHPVPGPPFDQYGIGMGIGLPDIPGPHGRFPHAPFQQPIPQHAAPGQMVQGYPGASAPRLQHHHSAPPGTHTQMIIEQDAGPMHRPGSGILVNPHIAPYPAPMPANLMRRSASPPSSMQRATNGLNAAILPGQPGSSKASGRTGFNAPGPSMQNMKELKRLSSGARAMDVDGSERDKERARFADSTKTRDKDDHVLAERDRDQLYERERDRVREHERERDRESDRETDRPGHIPLALQRMPSHPHPHQHLHPSAGAQPNHHHSPHHHHHHHHHVHHHHHANGPNGPNGPGPGVGQQAPLAALHTSNGLTSRNASPLPGRELDRRAHPGAPVEVIELSTKSVPGPVSVWKPNDEQGDSLNRARFDAGPSSRERAVPLSYPSSPRNGAITGPTSLAPSRRGSWSAPDDNGLPRPSSSASGPVPSGSNGSQRLPPTVSSSPRTQVSPSLPTQRSPAMVSPPRHNSIRLPPLSPSLGPRSPLRVAQPLPSANLPPISSPSKSKSPKILRRSPPPLSRPKSPGLSRDIHTPLSSGPPVISTSRKVTPTSPPSHFPPLSHPPLPSQRLPNIGVGSESVLAPPKVNAVPID